MLISYDNNLYLKNAVFNPLGERLATNGRASDTTAGTGPPLQAGPENEYRRRFPRQDGNVTM